jgi:hypothetical protein
MAIFFPQRLNRCLESLPTVVRAVPFAENEFGLFLGMFQSADGLEKRFDMLRRVAQRHQDRKVVAAWRRRRQGGRINRQARGGFTQMLAAFQAITRFVKGEAQAIVPFPGRLWRPPGTGPVVDGQFNPAGCAGLSGAVAVQGRKEVGRVDHQAGLVGKAQLGGCEQAGAGGVEGFLGLRQTREISEDVRPEGMAGRACHGTVEDQIGKTAKRRLPFRMGWRLLAQHDSLFVHDGVEGRHATAIDIGINTAEMMQ